ncbi:hypothetical protein VRK_34080 [Vibrio sp. MEBiC08052]|nr:hypothetical protein VRK_34080 [Vibrio sp. MEBiC08052]
MQNLKTVIEAVWRIDEWLAMLKEALKITRKVACRETHWVRKI